MPPYSTLEDLQSRFGRDEITRLLDQDADGSADSGRLDAAIADADARINSYLSGAYETPIEDCPLLTSISCDLARARLYDDAMPETVRDSFRSARATLRKISSGEVRLAASDGSVIARRSISAVRKAQNASAMQIDLENL